MITTAAAVQESFVGGWQDGTWAGNVVPMPALCQVNRGVRIAKL